MKRCAVLVLVLVGCSGTPEGGVAVCPASPDPEVLAALPAEAAPAGDAARGAALFERECARCHSADLAARGSRLFRGYPRLDCAEYLGKAPPAYLFKAIAEGGAAIGRDDLMKPFAEILSSEEIADLVAFLRAGT